MFLPDSFVSKQQIPFFLVQLRIRDPRVRLGTATKQKSRYDKRERDVWRRDKRQLLPLAKPYWIGLRSVTSILGREIQITMERGCVDTFFRNFGELFWPKIFVVDPTNPPERFHVEIILGILTSSCKLQLETTFHLTWYYVPWFLRHHFAALCCIT